MYAFKTSVTQPEDVHFEEDFQRVMVIKMSSELPKAVAFAMRTAR
jgi:hypothetical protein